MYIDIFLLIIILLIIVYSMRKGFFMEIFQIFSIIIAYWITKNYYYLISNSILKGIGNKSIRLVLSYTILFVIAFIVLLLIFSKIRDMVSYSRNVNLIDKTMGVFFGVLKSLIIFDLLIYLLIKFEILTRAEIINNSYIGKLLISISSNLGVF